MLLIYLLAAERAKNAVNYYLTKRSITSIKISRSGGICLSMHINKTQFIKIIFTRICGVNGDIDSI